MNPAKHPLTPATAISRRRMLSTLGASAIASSQAVQAQNLFQHIAQNLKGSPVNAYATELFKWDLTFCRYGLDIDPEGQGSVKTLWNDNWFKDADGNVVANFYTGFGAAWGAGSGGMGSTDPRGSRLPKTFRLTYYDYLEDRFYQVEGELPQQRLYELFKLQTVDNDVSYGRVIPRFKGIRVGVAPRGHIMMWASGYGNRKELQTYRGEVVMRDVTRKSYNESLPGGTFTLMEDRDKVLLAGRMKPETLARIKEGWIPDPAWYMRTIRVKYPWRHRLTGNVIRMTELESYQGNAEAQSVGAWEMALYQTSTAMRGVPDTAKFWFHDRAGVRHHLWVSFSLRERALSESDLSEVWTAFEKIFPGRSMDDNAYIPSEVDMATVEVDISEDFKRVAAFLVKGDMRIPIPVGRTQHFVLEPFTHWPGQKTEELKPEVKRRFLNGPDV